MVIASNFSGTVTICWNSDWWLCQLDLTFEAPLIKLKWKELFLYLLKCFEEWRIYVYSYSKLFLISKTTCIRLSYIVKTIVGDVLCSDLMNTRHQGICSHSIIFISRNIQVSTSQLLIFPHNDTAKAQKSIFFIFAEAHVILTNNIFLNQCWSMDIYKNMQYSISLKVPNIIKLPSN